MSRFTLRMRVVDSDGNVVGESSGQQELSDGDTFEVTAEFTKRGQIALSSKTLHSVPAATPAPTEKP